MKATDFTFRNKRGMTLVEIIVSIALIGILTAMVFTVFSTGILLSIKSGDNTRIAGIASGAVEHKLSGANVIEDGDELIIEGVDDDDVLLGNGSIDIQTGQTAQVSLNGGDDVEITGTQVSVDSDSDRNETSMKVFIPD